MKFVHAEDLLINADKIMYIEPKAFYIEDNRKYVEVKFTLTNGTIIERSVTESIFNYIMDM